jgi:hypothetical protein
MPTESYIYHPTPHFTARLQRVRRIDPAGHDRILAVIDRILGNPEDSDGVMHGAHHGKFKKYVGRRDYRILYYFCALCRKAGRRLTAVCDNCEKMPDNSVIFFDVYHKNEKEKLGY